MALEFEILRRGDGLSRICRISTPHGKIETPTLLPVINPRKRTISAKEIKSLGFQAIITNAYIIYRDPELRKRAIDEGIHSLLEFSGPIMTDSGTFQSYVYGGVEVSNSEIVSFQREIGVDIGTFLDVFTLPNERYDEVREKVMETFRRAKEAKEISGGMSLSCPIQGGIYEDLRELSARLGRSLNLDLYPIGGVVPLMESQRFSELISVILASKRGLGPGKPVHLFGCGHPMLFPISCLLGIDLFDSASYVKYARDLRILTPTRTYRLEDLEEFPFETKFLEGYTPKELIRDEERERIISLHNLAVVSLELKRVREAIRKGELWELVEMRARSHPKLLEALKSLKRYSEYLELFEPISSERALFYCGPETIYRPKVLRLRRRILERYLPRGKVAYFIRSSDRPFLERIREKVPKEAEVFVETFLGPIPAPLDMPYPVAQSEEPLELDEEVKEFIRREKEKILEKFSLTEIKGQGEVPLRELYSDLDRLKAIADYQFGLGASEVLFSGRISLVRSKTTGRVRNVIKDGKHVLSLRASDGLFTLKLPGAKILMKKFPPPRLRVIVSEESAEFNAKGRNVFCKFVLRGDPEIRPGDEVIVVDEGDNLLAVGRAILSYQEMLELEKGVAVKVREGVFSRALVIISSHYSVLLKPSSMTNPILHLLAISTLYSSSETMTKEK